MAHLCRTLKEFDDHLMSMKLRGQVVDTSLCNCFLGAVGLVPEIREPLPTRDFETDGKALEEPRQPNEDLSAEFQAFKELPPEEQRNG
ncbi:hypothetical protein GCM10020360_03830 [Nonlabens tegetincola]